MSPEHETSNDGTVITIGWKQVFIGGIVVGYTLCYWTCASALDSISILISPTNISSTIDAITNSIGLLSL